MADGLVEEGVVVHVLAEEAFGYVKSFFDVGAALGAEDDETMLELGLGGQGRLGDQPVGKWHGSGPVLSCEFSRG